MRIRSRRKTRKRTRGNDPGRGAQQDLSLIHILEERRASVGACSEMERVRPSFSSARRPICGTRPQVDKLMFRMPMPAPSGDEMRCKNLSTLS